MSRLSRNLNEKQAFSGLSIEDALAVIISFVILDGCLTGSGFELASFGYLIAALSVMISVRLKTRRKIIRDTFAYMLQGVVIYDPKK